MQVVQEYERAVIFRLGRLLPGGAKGPGIFFVLPCIESYEKVDLRTITLGVPPQEVILRPRIQMSLMSLILRCQVLTKDSVTVSVDAVVYYRVSNATVSVANVENAHHSTRYEKLYDTVVRFRYLQFNVQLQLFYRLLAQTSLRNILGTKNLHEILSDRDSISNSMQVRIMCLAKIYIKVISDYS